MAKTAKKFDPRRRVRGVYKSYAFKDHDPVLDAIDSVHELAGRPMFAKLAADSGVSAGTLSSWRRRETKRPQSASVEAVLRAMGAQRAVIWGGRVVRYGDTRPRLSVVRGGTK